MVLDVCNGVWHGQTPYSLSDSSSPSSLRQCFMVLSSSEAVLVLGESGAAGRAAVAGHVLGEKPRLGLLELGYVALVVIEDDTGRLNVTTPL